MPISDAHPRVPTTCARPTAARAQDESQIRALRAFSARLRCLPYSAIILQQDAALSLYSSVVERQSCKLKVLGSIPSGGLFLASARFGNFVA